MDGSVEAVLGRVVIDEKGLGKFGVAERSVWVWVSEEAWGRNEADEFCLLSAFSIVLCLSV
jgi:hypothetical protein